MNKYFDYLLELIFTPLCCICKKEGVSICNECESQLLYKFPAKQNFSNIEESQIKTLITPLVYDKNTKKIIKAIKFWGNYKIIDKLDKILESFWQTNSGFFKNAILCPIPLHPARYKKRGFNQSEKIAKILSKRFKITTLNILERNKNTSQQALLKKAERKENLQNAFKIKNPITDFAKKIILIDDVYSTGSTIKAAAKTIRNHYSKVANLNINGLTITYSPKPAIISKKI